MSIKVPHPLDFIVYGTFYLSQILLLPILTALHCTALLCTATLSVCRSKLCSFASLFSSLRALAGVASSPYNKDESLFRNPLLSNVFKTHHAPSPSGLFIAGQQHVSASIDGSSSARSVNISSNKKSSKSGNAKEVEDARRAEEEVWVDDLWDFFVGLLDRWVCHGKLFDFRNLLLCLIV